MFLNFESIAPVSPANQLDFKAYGASTAVVLCQQGALIQQGTPQWSCLEEVIAPWWQNIEFLLGKRMEKHVFAFSHFPGGYKFTGPWLEYKAWKIAYCHWVGEKMSRNLTSMAFITSGNFLGVANLGDSGCRLRGFTHPGDTGISHDGAGFIINWWAIENTSWVAFVATLLATVGFF